VKIGEPCNKKSLAKQEMFGKALCFQQVAVFLFASQFFQHRLQFFQFRTAFAVRAALDFAAFCFWITFAHE